MRSNSSGSTDDQCRYSCPSAVRERSRSRCADQSAAKNGSLEPDLPVGSSRTAIPNGRVDPSCALVLRQWPSTTAWSNYAAKQLIWPYGPHQNRLTCTEFFNTHTKMHSPRSANFRWVKAWGSRPSRRPAPVLACRYTPGRSSICHFER